MTQKVTIRDVAKAAGVSPSTVSHVLSGKRSISEAVCSRVKKVVASLGYRANATAVRLSTNKTWQVGVVVREVRNSITGELLEHMEESLRKAGYKMLLGIAHDDKALALSYIRDFSSGLSDGVINMVPVVSVMDAAKECGIVPVVTYQRPHPDSPALFDKLAGAMSVLEHLWSLGHRKIGLLYARDVAVEVRMDPKDLGFRQFHVHVGVALDESMICEVEEFSPESIYSGAERLRRNRASAILAGNDMIAVSVLRWAHQRGIAVPGGLSVAGFDDSPVARDVVPALTTVQVPVKPLIDLTVKALLDRIEGRPLPSQEMLPMRLIVRESTGKPS